MSVIEVTELKRAFPDVKGWNLALNGLNLSVEAGEVVGLLGRNGAGKTTLLHTLMGIYPVDSGQVRLFGLDPRESPVEVKSRLAQGENMEPLVVDVREAARLLSISPYTIRAYIRTGRIHALKCGTRVIVPMEEVRRVVRDGIPPRPQKLSTTSLAEDPQPTPEGVATR